ncbi:DUF5723 family protein [Roseivirga pacifica]|uniref:DUF5723 family protein n=1 Tax=Roseivirga pacifica TaxID=1267423 RepID=UPI003BA98DA4
MRAIATLFCFLFFGLLAQAQRFNGYIQSDYSGILSAQIQPAAIANNPYKYDLNILHGNFYVVNNIAYTRKNNEGNTGLARYLDSGTRYANGDVTFGGLSGLLSLKNRDAIGWHIQMRGALTGDDITPEFITQVGRFQTNNFANNTVSNQRGDASFGFWSEFGLTYATVLSDNGYTRWKAGATLKFVNPLGNVWVEMDDLDYSTDQDGYATITNMQMQVGYSSNMDSFEQFDGTDPFSIPNGTGFRPALDFGITYESVSYRDDPKTKQGTSYYADIQYEHRLSFSITDFGKMNFSQGSASFQVLGVLPGQATTISMDSLLTGIGSVREFRDSLSTIAQVIDKRGDYTVSLPTAFNASYDYNMNNNWYFSISTQIDLSSFMKADYRLAYSNSVTLMPRYEVGEYGLYAPFYYNFDGDTEFGLAARYGPVTIGTQSIGSLLNSEKDSMGFFFSISINKLKANSEKPYCFGGKKTGSAYVRQERTPLYKRKKFLFF